ncbi:hypothetical protein BE221DRAFT_79432 [Ostreococcus tauri]|uniref:Uncharacterized protein n=1 Tax=Ostreococcus tauri TaxID=70448 RepID=A0A1Y5I3J3_OSTTA|nr:hypothetical protein BE221DRAFT_79432 [Ostreococcus tauri]
MAHVAIVGVASKSNTALDEARAKLERCECELALTHADHDEALDRLDEAKDECEKLKKQAKTERETSARLRFALTVANGQKEKLKVENERLTLAEQKKAGEEARANEEVRMLKEKVANANKATEQARKSVQELTAKNGALVKELEALRHELEDGKMAISGLDAARKRNVELAEEIEKRHQEYSAIEHALQDAEINLRQAESHNVQLKLENEDLSDHVVQLRAHELELQQELKNMLETLTMVTSQHAEDDEGAEGGASGFASPIAMERIMAKINTPTAERIGAHAGEDDDMQDSRGVQDAPGNLQSHRRVGRTSSQTARHQIRDGCRRGLSAPGSGIRVAGRVAHIASFASDDVKESHRGRRTDDDRARQGRQGSADSAANFGCGAVPRTDGCDGRCAECYRIKQEKLAQSPLSRFSNSIKKVLSPNKEKEKTAGGKKKGKKKGKK